MGYFRNIRKIKLTIEQLGNLVLIANFNKSHRYVDNEYSVSNFYPLGDEMPMFSEKRLKRISAKAFRKMLIIFDSNDKHYFFRMKYKWRERKQYGKYFIINLNFTDKGIKIIEQMNEELRVFFNLS